MRWIAAMVLAFALATPAAAETTDVEQLKLRPEKFVGTSVTIEGIVSMTTRENALITFRAGRLSDGSFPFSWPDRGTVWEFAQHECAGVEDAAKCTATVTGTLDALEGFADSYVVRARTVELGRK